MKQAAMVERPTWPETESCQWPISTKEVNPSNSKKPGSRSFPKGGGDYLQSQQTHSMQLLRGPAAENAAKPGPDSRLSETMQRGDKYVCCFKVQFWHNLWQGNKKLT